RFQLRSFHRLRAPRLHGPARHTVHVCRRRGVGHGRRGAYATISDFLSGTVEAVFAGLTASTVRWLVIDTVHHRTGVKPPSWDFAALGTGAGAFEVLIQIHYQYYKFYANMVVALAWAYLSGAYALGWKGLAYW